MIVHDVCASFVKIRHERRRKYAALQGMNVHDLRCSFFARRQEVSGKQKNGSKFSLRIDLRTLADKNFRDLIIVVLRLRDLNSEKSD